MAQESALCDKCRVELTVEEKPLQPLTKEQLSSTYVPSDVEASQIQSVIQSAEHTLKRYDAEIIALTDLETLATLEKQRADLQNDLRRHHAMVSAIRKLPFEILGEIFSWCCAQGLIIGENEVLTPALALSQTCSSWRTVALDTSKLWSNMSLNIECAQSPLVNLHLLRAKSAPLTLEVKGERTIVDDTDILLPLPEISDSALAILKSLIDAADRWHSASFRLNWDVLFDTSSRLDEDIWSSSRSRLSISSRSNATELENLVTTNFGRDVFHVGRLRTLTVEGYLPSPSTALSLLHDCPHLREIKLHGCLWYMHDHAPMPVTTPFTHDKLVSLDYKLTCFDELVFTLTLPSLTTLVLGGYLPKKEERQPILAGIKDMLVRSGCQLVTLRVTGNLFDSDNDIVELLALAPTVRNFTLYCVSGCSEDLFLDDLFRLLSIDNSHSTPGTPHLLPQLESLELAFLDSYARNPLPNPEGILKMVKSRTSLSASVARLLCFHLVVTLFSYSSASREWVESFISVEPRLRALKGNGLDIGLHIDTRQWDEGVEELEGESLELSDDEIDMQAE
ncbi:hypothetical protein D9758_004196 [Tetrapyrgos nigripes]|uniref:F-box domain-containing protein n=1 Tax=Tetrapyrgos nigripes TaxID=182062 RepID=A0A8H5GUA6_9AGAR|nr:hypothetical protein D9758_004196 [Tetrapyrgos nigripes]